jgi:hypothetical protein
MSPVSWGDIFTLLLRGDRIMELRQDEYSGLTSSEEPFILRVKSFFPAADGAAGAE